MAGIASADRQIQLQQPNLSSINGLGYTRQPSCIDRASNRKFKKLSSLRRLRTLNSRDVMPTIEENCSLFDESYDWPEAGEEWSKDWGGAQMQWYGCILPRISAFVPAQTILEIAPG
jgi:hypothetical protein